MVVLHLNDEIKEIPKIRNTFNNGLKKGISNSNWWPICMDTESNAYFSWQMFKN